MTRRLAALLAALSLTLVAVAPAFAAELTNETPISSDSFEEGTAGDCTFTDEINGGTVSAGEGEVLWHFVLNQSPTDTQTLTANFVNAGTQPGVLYKVEDHYVLHFYIITDDPDTLNSASTSGAGNLQLSHVCHGTPPPVIPESPFAVLLVLTGGLTAAWYVSRKMRSSVAPKAL